MLGVLRSLFREKPLLVVINDSPHQLLKGEAIQATAIDGSQLLVTRRSDGAILVDAYEAPYRTGKRNHR